MMEIEVDRSCIKVSNHVNAIYPGSIWWSSWWVVDLLRKNRSQDNTDLVYPYLDTLVTGYPQETEIRYAKILCVAINFIGFYRLKYFKILVPECT